MSGAIPLKVKSSPKGVTIGGGVKAIGFEILSYLERFLESGESAAIDMRGLPMAPNEYTELLEMLGQGELDLSLEMAGTTRIRETAFSGVWWIQHKGPDDRIQSEYIEINRIPEFLCAQTDQIEDAVRELSDRLRGAL
ncbi:hydrogenase expression/formation protein [Wenzhouxiangella limi]|uniref:Hydrogenase expression/formation protein n=1 Tax=Wenzhouxiangella limi TaxID=2707351 RepID=A0A845V6W3_9GAMM|nr:hydrogenase expression/formation protein [Wenzhouxiangella limi]NDY95705.1 hydrogenase expression/formation protein [Wenzhouxiangella limi]